MNTATMRLNRLFHPDSGAGFVVAFDRGLGASVVGGGEDALGIIGQLTRSDADGILLSPGLLERSRHLFAHSNAPAAIVRSDFFLSGGLLPHGTQGAGNAEEHRLLCSPAQAQAMGADALAMFLILGNAEDRATADNAQIVATVAAEAHEIGLPVIVETVLWGSRVENQSDPVALAYACRLAAELGSDAVKTQYTGDRPTMEQVVRSCPVPVLVLGGPKTDSLEELALLTEQALSSGARGAVYGRNIWLSDDPVKAANRIAAVTHRQSWVA